MADVSEGKTSEPSLRSPHYYPSDHTTAMAVVAILIIRLPCLPHPRRYRRNRHQHPYTHAQAPTSAPLHCSSAVLLLILLVLVMILILILALEHVGAGFLAACCSPGGLLDPDVLQRPQAARCMTAPPLNQPSGLPLPQIRLPCRKGSSS